MESMSVLAFYREALQARRRIEPDSRLEWLKSGRDDVLAFQRGRLTYDLRHRVRR